MQVDKKQWTMQLLHAERNLEAEVKRREEVEELLESERQQRGDERKQYVGQLSGTTKEAKEMQERTQKVLDQVALQGDVVRLQLAQEQIRAQNAEDFSQALAQEASANKMQLQKWQTQMDFLRSSTARLRLHQVKLREHKLESMRREETAALISKTFVKWKKELLQAKWCVQCCRILTSIRMQRYKLSRYAMHTMQP